MNPDVTIFHNPACGTSRNVLGLIRNAGIEPRIVHYLQTPPARDELRALIAATGQPARALLRMKEVLKLDPALADRDEDAILDAMLAHPILIERPVVVTPLGTRLCRPSETVLDILPAPQRGAFAKEDGQPVTDTEGRRV